MNLPSLPVCDANTGAKKKKKIKIPLQLVCDTFWYPCVDFYIKQIKTRLQSHRLTCNSNQLSSCSKSKNKKSIIHLSFQIRLKHDLSGFWTVCKKNSPLDFPPWQKGFFPNVLTRGLTHLQIQILFLLFASFQISVKSCTSNMYQNTPSGWVSW